MSGIRSTTGCYTCRLRKKKCDELHPICLSCSSRSLPCYGYGAKPAWADGAELEEQKVREIKRAAEANYRARRRRWKPAPAAVAQPSLALPVRVSSTEAIELKQETDPGPPLVREEAGVLVDHLALASSTIPTERGPQENAKDDDLLCLESTHTSSPATTSGRGLVPPTSLVQRPPMPASVDSMWWDSGFSSTVGIKSRTDLGLVINYVGNVFAFQFGFDLPSPKLGFYAFLEALQSNAFYYATLSLSAHHRSLLADGNLNSPKNLSAGAQLSYSLALRALQQLMVSLGQLSGAELLRARFNFLGAIEQMLSLEVFRELGSSWEFHLEAARTILCMIGSSAVNSKASCTPIGHPKRLDAVEALLRNPRDGLLSPRETRSLRFYATNYIWVDIISNATGLRSSNESPFEYLGLLESGVIQLQAIMGCENWVMIIIAKIALLENWKKKINSSSKLNVTELATRAAVLEEALDCGIRRLLDARIGLGGLDLDRNLVTEMFALAAVTYLHVVVSGPYPEVPEIRRSAERTLRALCVLPSRLLIRVSWPFCVTGCMAVTEEELLFENIAATAAKFGELTGTIWKALAVMRSSWGISRRRSERDRSWTAAMENLHVRVLLV